MKNNEFESPEIKRIDREAADWVAKKIGGFTAKDQDAFFDWLAGDPRHGEWYERHKKTWKNLDQLAQWLPEHSDKPNQDLLKHRYPRYFWGWMSGIAAALILGLVVFLSMAGPRKSQYIATNLVANAYESHELPDGSVVELNQGAALKVKYTKALRRVELVSSEAHFDVTKDPDRPFIVRVRGIDIRAVGTAFNVRLTDQSVQVIVTEGKVRVTASPTNKDVQGTMSYDESLYKQELVVGQMTEVPVDRDSLSVEDELKTEVKAVSLGEMNQLLSWKPQMFEFDSTPLSEVVEEFNSRNQTHLVIGDAELTRLPIVASFRSANVEHFVELLQLSIELEIEREGNERIILRSAQ